MPPKLNLAGFTDEYLMDIPEIDEQHKAFFELLDTINGATNDLYKPLSDDEVDDVIEIGRAHV